MALSSSIKRGVIISCGAVVAVLALKKSLASRVAEPYAISPTGMKGDESKKKRKRGFQHWARILRLLRIYKDTHFAKILLAMLGCAFVFSVVDVRKAFVSGQLFRAVFEGDRSAFKKLLAFNIGLSIILTMFNKVLANLVSSLGRHWHKLIVDRMHYLYFAGNNYYRIQNLIELPHERLATDAPQLTRDMALITCDFVNALTNFVVFSRQVYKFGKRISGDRVWSGARLVVGPVGYATLGSIIISKFVPNLGFVRKTQRELESKYKQSHVRLCRNAEAVAIYSGEGYEKEVVGKHFDRLTSFNENVRWAALPSELVKEYVTKYALHTCMMLLVLTPFFNPADPSKGESPGQTMYRIKVLSELIVMELIALSQLARLGNTVQRVSGLVERVGDLVTELDDLTEKSHSPDVRGTTADKSIEFRNVTIHTPAGHKLVSGLSFTIKPGENFLICGPNGMT
jgi:putative ATP-binding cassette transporter